MYLHRMIGTGNYTTSTTNMYNNTDYKNLPGDDGVDFHAPSDPFLPHDQQRVRPCRHQCFRCGESRKKIIPEAC